MLFGEHLAVVDVDHAASVAEERAEWQVGWTVYFRFIPLNAQIIAPMKPPIRRTANASPIKAILVLEDRLPRWHSRCPAMPPIQTDSRSETLLPQNAQIMASPLPFQVLGEPTEDQDRE